MGLYMMTAKPEVVFDRDREWADLDRFVGGRGRRIAVVYGRRRQGKSFLLRAIAGARGGFYYQALEEESRPALDHVGQAIAAYAGAPAWTAPRFEDWASAFRVLCETAAGRPIVLDEFSFLIRKSPDLPSVIEAAYDAARAGDHPVFCLVLCGSALSVMADLLTGQRALRGRAMNDLLIEPFDFRVSRQFWGIEDHETAFLVNAVLGGPPGYRDLLDGAAPQSPAEFAAWLSDGVLNPSHALFREAEYLLAEDPALADRSLYQTIVAAVATGTARRDDLAGVLGRKSTALEHPLTQLERARFVYRDDDLLRRNRPLLRVADPLVRFHYAVIRPDQSRFDTRRTAEAWADAGDRFRSQVLGPHFEILARDWTAAYASSQTLGGTAKRVGFVKVDVAHEKRGYEIDVTVEGDGRTSGGRTRLLAIGEAKASERERTTSDLDRLVKLRGELGSRADVAGTRILLFGRSGFNDELRREAEGRQDVELIDLARMYEGT